MTAGRANNDLTTLILSAGGSNGPALVGAVTKLMEHKRLDQLKRVAGCSAGSLVGLGVALNFNAEELVTLLWELNISKFLDMPSGLCGRAGYLFNKGGLYRSRYAREYLNALVEKKLGIKNATFKDLKNHGAKDLFIFATNMAKKQLKVFSCETTPDVCVADAIYSSMTVPGLLAPLCWKEKNGQLALDKAGDPFFDGGILDVCPLGFFDKQKYAQDDRETVDGNQYAYNSRALALFLDHVSYDNYTVHNIVESLVFGQKKQSIMNSPGDLARTWFIPVTGNPLDFSKKDDDKNKLFQWGQEVAENCLAGREKEYHFSDRQVKGIRARL